MKLTPLKLSHESKAERERERELDVVWFRKSRDIKRRRKQRGELCNIWVFEGQKNERTILHRLVFKFSIRCFLLKNTPRG